LNDFDVVSQKSEGGKIDGIEVGGRNLISESLISSSFGDMDKSEYVSKGIIRFSSSAQYGGVRITAHPLLPNTEYVMRYRYKKTSGTLVSFGGHTGASWSNNKTYVDGIEKGAHAGTSSGFVSDDDIEHEVVVYINTPDEITVGDLFYIQENRGNTTPVKIDIYDLKLEKGTKATDWTPAPEDVPYDTLENNLYKTNISLSEPLRSVGDVKDRLFRDEDGKWKVERNVAEKLLDGSETFSVETRAESINMIQAYTRAPNGLRVGSTNVGLSSHFPILTQEETMDKSSSTQGVEGINVVNNYSVIRVRLDTEKRLGKKASAVNSTDLKDFFKKDSVLVYYPTVEPTIETLPDDLQTKLNNISSFAKGNSAYTLFPDKSEILSPEVLEQLKPVIRATFKGGGWYNRWK